MGKVISSPVDKFPGAVTLYDPLPWPVYKAWTEAVGRAGELRLKDDAGEPVPLNAVTISIDDQLTEAMLSGICACVEKWNLNGGMPYTPETFPATPRVEAGRLVRWLASEINMIVKGEEASPNA